MKAHDSGRPPTPNGGGAAAERRGKRGTTGGEGVEPARHPYDEFIKWRQLVIKYMLSQGVSEDRLISSLTVDSILIEAVRRRIHEGRL